MDVSPCNKYNMRKRCFFPKYDRYQMEHCSNFLMIVGRNYVHATVGAMLGSPVGLCVGASNGATRCDALVVVRKSV